MGKLTNTVYDLLREKDPELAISFERGFSPLSDDELVELNRYLRGQLSKAPVSTFEERSCLVDTLSDRTWLEYFEDLILPTLVRFNLPS